MWTTLLVVLACTITNTEAFVPLSLNVDTREAAHLTEARGAFFSQDDHLVYLESQAALPTGFSVRS